MPHKRWSTFAEPRDDVISFEINGETFLCLPQLPAAAFRAVGSWTTTVMNACKFIEATLAEDDDVIRFNQVLDSKTKIVTGEDVQDIMNWLIEVYTQRPTTSPEESQNGRSTPNAGSAGDSSSTHVDSTT